MMNRTGDLRPPKLNRQSYDLPIYPLISLTISLIFFSYFVSHTYYDNSSIF